MAVQLTCNQKVVGSNPSIGFHIVAFKEPEVIICYKLSPYSYDVDDTFESCDKFT